MNFLLDTHILMWALLGDAKIPGTAKRLIEDTRNTIFFSAVSLWEVALKKYLSRNGDILPSPEALYNFCKQAGYTELPVTAIHTMYLERIDAGTPPIHKDPFDRMLICQAETEDMLLVTSDKQIARYPQESIFFTPHN